MHNANSDDRFEGGNRHHHRPLSLFPGLVLLAIGAVFLLDNLNVLYLREWVRYWPVILIAVGLAKLVDSSFAGGRVAGVVLLIVGGLFLAHNLGFLMINMHDFWPLILIGIGLLLLWQRTQPGPMPGRDPNAWTASTLNEWAIFGGSKRRVTAPDFQGGQISTMFGGAEIDLRNAGISGGSAVIEANAMFGGIEIRIPPNWSAVVQGIGIFGGFNDGTLQPDPASNPNPPRLFVKGSAVFGGVEVKN